ncbi:pyridoxamine 5'-phosphate oxidase family protein [Sphingobacterium wenxiniae]|uniref:General stress protein 26 n=1 Tax=Sphingobacterium wenxiniae TaxID=683125 RepID=A0A1I6QFV5_9SPHI|nr:pyridoxamine 5'-phosphate oxidase family protein [Sphingobacterium wenxiniae]SFS51369.1 General stress protein 26 [Sphingobacterium wenxiniae]
MSTENLNNQEAIEKVKEMVDKIDISMMCSFTSESDYPHAVPMSRQEVDDGGNIWFLFSSESETYRNLQKNNKVSLLYAHVGDYNFLSVNGTAVISQDQERIDKYWNKMIEAWFEKGKKDSRIRVLKVTPTDAYYWDNKSNKLVTLMKIVASAVSGQQLDIGREGELNL